jgi:hypothetical protein
MHLYGAGRELALVLSYMAVQLYGGAMHLYGAGREPLYGGAMHLYGAAPEAQTCMPAREVGSESWLWVRLWVPCTYVAGCGCHAP